MGACLFGDAGGRLIADTLTDALARFASLPVVVVASDYDGTLAPIVDDPEAARPDGDALEAFVRLSRREGVVAVIVSGRTTAHLESVVGVDPRIQLIGNHGASDADPSAVEQLVGDLRSLTDEHPGAFVEPKPSGCAFHYRHTSSPDRAAESARDVARESGAHVIDGKMVVEAVLGTGDKGTAVETVRRTTRADAVLFIGDDTTDEAAFRVLAPPDVTVKVGSGETAAIYRVTEVGDVAEIFETLDRLRRRAP
ncbi:MAG: trehalose-phosphatase [Acidimicrobiia bacterium]|nr:trehalose-phosphatase [Acidimicrobiia bacterium]